VFDFSRLSILTVKMGKFLPLQNQELVNLTPCDRLPRLLCFALSEINVILLGPIPSSG
jgi:hypothetical protein